MILFFLASCVPQYVSINSYEEYVYFDYADIKEKYGISVTPLSTFEAMKFDAIGDYKLTLHPAIINKDDYNKLNKEEKNRYSREDVHLKAVLFIEQLRYTDCLDLFLNNVKKRGANGVLQFRIESERGSYTIDDTKNILVNAAVNARNFTCSGILVKTVE